MFELTEREKSILRDVIHQFILTANPVGSRNIAKTSELKLSPASIRNIMADLEEAGYLKHPHTSAGRVPTDMGYRLYVDSLMTPADIDFMQQDLIKKELDSISDQTDDLLKITASILSRLTNQLACITLPNLSKAKLDKIQIVEISSTRILVVITVESGLVKTITLELETEIDRKKMYSVQQFLNERLSGLYLSEIRKTFIERLKDFQPDHQPIIRVFFDSVEKIFTDDKKSDKIVIAGTKNIIQQPEFENHKHLMSIIELIEDQEVIVHFMDDRRLNKNEDVIITIGNESDNDRFSSYSLITKDYKIGHASGSLGVIGPKRMQYNKAIASVIYIAELLNSELNNKK